MIQKLKMFVILLNFMRHFIKFLSSNITVSFWTFILDYYHYICNVKLANSASPFQFYQVKFPQKIGLENI